MIANTKKQDLAEHSFAVAYLSKKIVERETTDKNLPKLTFLAALLHDVGKVDPEYQSWAQKGKVQFPLNGEHIETGKFSFEKHARHNEISLLIANFLMGTDRSERRLFSKKNGISNFKLLDSIFHSVYWHHAKPLRKEEFDSLATIFKKGVQKNLSEILSSVDQVLVKTNDYCKQYGMTEMSYSLDLDNIEDQIKDLDRQDIPEYKKYEMGLDDVGSFISSVRSNARNNIARSSVIYADRLISSLSAEELSNHIRKKTLESLLVLSTKDSGLTLSIKNHIDTFYPNSDRTTKQDQVALKLSQKTRLSVLCGAAGSGKTTIGIRWAHELGAEKVYWIVPRVSVAQGVFEELSSNEYLPGSTIEIFTGDYKISKRNGKEWETKEEDHLTGDVVITTIDQLVNGITTHRNISIFSDFMSHHVVFDEYHEYVNMESYNLLFSELVHCKMLSDDKAKALLISATPNYFFTEHMLEVDPYDIVEMESSNRSLYKIAFEEYDDETPCDNHPLYKSVPNQSIVISNTAVDAQRSFLKNLSEDSSVLFHSKLASKDKNELFNRVFNSFKKNGTHEFSVLRASPIVQASLNITCFNMISEMTTPENLLQRIGRLDRFGVSLCLNLFTIAVPKSVVVGKQVDMAGSFLGKMHSFRTVCAWYKFLKDNAQDEMTIPEIYGLYKKFYRSAHALEAIEQELVESLNKSAQAFNSKISEPVWIKPKANKKNKLKKTSLRGDSRYVQLAVADADESSYEIKNEYAITKENQLTLSVSDLKGDDSPLNLMFKKHHQIPSFKLNGIKKEYDSSVLIEKARDEDNPIFASYTPDDVSSVNEINSDSSQLYVRCKKQIIGCMRLKTLANLI